jgi:hypothetical protein
MNRHLKSLGFVVTILAASVMPLLCLGADTGATFETPGENLDRDLKPIRAHVQSMKAKVERGVGSLSVDDDDEAAVVQVEGWAERCCTRSIRTAYRRTTALEKRAGNLVKLYEAEGRADGARLAGEMAADAVALREQLDRFASAPDKSSAFAALQNVVKGVINLNIDRRDLEACCNDIRVPVPPDEKEQD